MAIIKNILALIIIFISIPLSSAADDKGVEYLNSTPFKPLLLIENHGVSVGMSYASSSVVSYNINKCISFSYYENITGVEADPDVNYTLSMDIMNSKDDITKIYSAGAIFIMIFKSSRDIYFTSSLITRIAYVDAPSYTIEENGEKRSVNAKKAGAGSDITFGIGKKNIVLEAFAGVINTKDVIYQKYGLQLKVFF